MDAYSQLLQSLLQPLTPDLSFCLAGAQHPIPGSILRVTPLKAALCGVVLTCKETRLTVPTFFPTFCPDILPLPAHPRRLETLSQETEPLLPWN